MNPATIVPLYAPCSPVQLSSDNFTGAVFPNPISSLSSNAQNSRVKSELCHFLPLSLHASGKPDRHALTRYLHLKNLIHALLYLLFFVPSISYPITSIPPLNSPLPYPIPPSYPLHLYSPFDSLLYSLLRPPPVPAREVVIPRTPTTTTSKVIVVTVTIMSVQEVGGPVLEEVL